MKLIRIIARAGVIVASVAALLGVTGVAASAAEPATAHSAAVTVQPLTDPPGDCTADEAGDIKIDQFGILYQCEHIPYEGWYWIPF